MEQGDFDVGVHLDTHNKDKNKYKEELLTKEELNKAIEVIHKFDSI